MGSNEFSQTEELHSKEALFGNMVKPVWNPSTLLEKGSGILCLINQGLSTTELHPFPSSQVLCHHKSEMVFNRTPKYRSQETDSIHYELLYLQICGCLGVLWFLLHAIMLY